MSFVCKQVVAFVLALLVAAKYLYLDESRTEGTSPNSVKEERNSRLTQLGLKGKKRIRRATFTCGDDGFIDEETSDIETSNQHVITEKLNVTLKETMDTKVSPKKRSFSFAHHIPKWKRCHSFNDSLITTVQEGTPKESSTYKKGNNKKESLNTPSIVVCEHQDVLEELVMSGCVQSAGSKSRTCRDGVRTVEECKKVMKEPVSVTI